MPFCQLLPFLFWGRGPPSKIDRRKGTLVQASVLEDLVDIKHGTETVVVFKPGKLDIN